MYIESVPNRSSPPAILLRESFREGGKVKKRTLANLTKWPSTLVEGFRVLLKGGTAVPSLEDAFDIVRSLPCGHVAAVLGTMKKLGLDRLIDPKPSPRRNQVLAMIAARILEPASKLATARGLAEATAVSTLGEDLDTELDEDDLYGAMDWLLERQERIERGLARRHLEEGSLVLYDLTSVWMEGRACPLARRGHSGTARRASCRSPSACCAIGTAARSRWRYSPATRRIRRRFPHSSLRCASGSLSRRWFWWGTGGC